MKIIKRLTNTFVVAAFMLLFSCEDNDVKPDDDAHAIGEFIEEVNANPVTINGIKLGDSWRVVRYKYAYRDGDSKKEDDVDYLKMDNVCKDYKEYWIFNSSEVMQAYKGNCHDKNWDNYHEKFNQTIDATNGIVTIDYVFDGGDKQFNESWTISTLTDSELILKRENEEEDYLYQYTFRREKF